ncbi:hypothetical protein Taro_016796, partial [Colocasia esculenta]|nr:hypothetical protein [Colocasia esculenta]
MVISSRCGYFFYTPPRTPDRNGKASTYVIDYKLALNHFWFSVFMGFDSIEDFFEEEGIRGQSGLDAAGLMEEVGIELSCARFPCITLGDSPLVELYNETLCQSAGMNLFLSESCNNSYLPCSKDMVTEPENTGRFSSLGSHPSEKTSSSSNKMDFHLLSCASQPHLLDSKKMKFSAKESSSTGKQTGISTSTGLILDKPIKMLEGILSRQCRQLENGGFHTVRKLLQHFPRTYADLQNSQELISDGQYLMFVGTVLSSRGIRAGISFSFLEVVVSCDFSSNNHNSENQGNGNCSQKRIVYLHLKRFFRGTRFTNQTFLRSIQSKYKEGDHVYVSGKVKKLQAEDHYEMREYSIDILDEEEEMHAYTLRRPYPIYPSKAGLKPGFLRNAISRALKLVPLDIDPIPDEVLQEFNLLNLRDAYLGIHHPRNLDEADSARRRLIFDDFFYLQLGRLYQMLEVLGTRIEKEDLLDRYRKQGLNTVSIDDWSTLAKKFLQALPYSLTPSQLSAASEIIWDIKRHVPMNRLLQGDVGCGKTVVAFLACMEVIDSGFQHYEYLLSLLENMESQDKPSVVILTGSTPPKQSRIIRQGLQSGDIDLVIGTHSLIAEKVGFSALRIAVVDEQQRFGVIQRGRFGSK